MDREAKKQIKEILKNTKNLILIGDGVGVVTGDPDELTEMSFVLINELIKNNILDGKTIEKLEKKLKEKINE